MSNPLHPAAKDIVCDAGDIATLASRAATLVVAATATYCPEGSPEARKLAAKLTEATTNAQSVAEAMAALPEAHTPTPETAAKAATAAASAVTCAAQAAAVAHQAPAPLHKNQRWQTAARTAVTIASVATMAAMNADNRLRNAREIHGKTLPHEPDYSASATTAWRDACIAQEAGDTLSALRHAAHAANAYAEATRLWATLYATA